MDGKLCLRDDKNAAFVLTSPSLPMVDEHGKLSLVTMSASAYIENLA